MNDADEKVPCPSCTRTPRTRLDWPYIGDSCGHVECPNRRRVTAAPPGPLGYGPPRDEPSEAAWLAALGPCGK